VHDEPILLWSKVWGLCYVFHRGESLANTSACRRPLVASALPPEDLAQLQQLGVDIAQVMRATGILILAIALVYVVLGVLAWTGRRWARALLGAFTAGFVLMVAAAVFGAGSQGLALDAGGVLVLVVPLVLALAALALMFGGAARDWFARRR